MGCQREHLLEHLLKRERRWQAVSDGVLSNRTRSSATWQRRRGCSSAAPRRMARLPLAGKDWSVFGKDSFLYKKRVIEPIPVLPGCYLHHKL